MTSVKKPRAVILDAGIIGEVHRPAVQLVGGEIVGVMASTPQRSDEVAVKWGTTPVHDTSELAALARDVVHVCGPNGLHVPHAEAALDAGAHVICEKPLAIGTEDAEHLAEAAHAAGRIATVPFVYRSYPLAREIRQRVRSGEFGRWQLLHGSHLQAWLLDPTATSWRVDPAKGEPSRTLTSVRTGST